MITEVQAKGLKTKKFIEEKVAEIRAAVGDGLAINALSGGVDSSTVTLLGHRALGKRLKTVFIENGLMREGEPRQVVALFRKLKVPVEIVDAREEFFSALKGITDPEEKREAITQTFYRKVFGRIVKASGARFLLQGTILTDVDETVAGIKRQHNVFAQLGIDPQEAFGYGILEPLLQLRKDGVRKLGKALGLPEETYRRIPFPGPALAARVIGEATPERIETVRRGHGRGGKTPQGHPGLSVPGDPARGPRDRHARGQTRVRPADRGALLGQHRRPRGRPHPAAVRRS
jgi:GMP synthase (glutamine-hydrolysing)